MKHSAFYSGKKVLITGHTGFKGSWMTKLLIELGAEVTGYALDPDNEHILFGLSDVKKNIKHVIGDIRDHDKLLQLITTKKPEIVFHMAAQPLVRRSYEIPYETFEVNAMGTVNVLECIRKTNSVVSFVNITTDKVYENIEQRAGYKEDDRLCGYDPYSNSKSCSELITYSYKNSFFQSYDAPAISTARSGNVIGGGDYSKNRIIPDCIRAALAKKTIEVRNPNSVRPYQHVLDCLSGYLAIAEAQWVDRNKQGSYNFGPKYDDYITTGELADLFCNAWGEEASWINKNEVGPHEAGLLRLNIDKAKEELNWVPKWNIKTALDYTIVWAKAYRDNTNVADCMKDQINSYFQ